MEWKRALSSSSRTKALSVIPSSLVAKVSYPEDFIVHQRRRLQTDQKTFPVKSEFMYEPHRVVLVAVENTLVTG